MLAYSITRHRARESIQEPGVAEEPSRLAREVAANVFWGGHNLADDLVPPVEERHDG